MEFSICQVKMYLLKKKRNCISVAYFPFLSSIWRVFMKKFLVVLLILAAAGMGFAQNLGFNGIVNSGIGFFKSDHRDSELIVGHYASSEHISSMAHIWTHLSSSGNTAGLRFLFRATAGFGADDTLAGQLQFQNYEGWVRFFDDIVEVRGGKMDYKEFYNPFGGVEAHMFNAEGWGMIVNANPFAGFNMRFGIFPAGSLGQAIHHERTRFNLSFRYDIFGTANVMLNTVAHNEDLYDIGFGVQLIALRRMVRGLRNVNFDIALLNIMESRNLDMGIQTGIRVDYFPGSLGTGIRFAQFFIKGSDPDLTFAGYVQYSLGNIVPRINLGVNIGQPLRGVNVPGPGGDDFRGGANFYESIHKGRYYEGLNPGGIRRAQEGMANFVFNTTVQFQVTGQQFIELGYVRQQDLSENKRLRTANNVVSLEFKILF